MLFITIFLQAKWRCQEGKDVFAFFSCHMINLDTVVKYFSLGYLLWFCITKFNNWF